MSKKQRAAVYSEPMVLLAKDEMIDILRQFLSIIEHDQVSDVLVLEFLPDAYGIRLFDAIVFEQFIKEKQS